jgi:hypothetical protein
MAWEAMGLIGLRFRGTLSEKLYRKNLTGGTNGNHTDDTRRSSNNIKSLNLPD